MYQPGTGYRFDTDEKAAFDQAVAAFHTAVERGGCGVSQNAFADIIRAAQPAFSEGELRCAIRLFLSPEAQARLQWLRDIEDRIAAKPFLLGWSDEEDELCSSTHATLLEATRAMKQLKGQCFVTAFIDDKRA